MIGVGDIIAVDNKINTEKYIDIAE